VWPAALPGALCQHFVLARVPKGDAEMVAATIGAVCAEPDAEDVHARLDVIAGMLGRQIPQVGAMLREAADGLPAFTAFPLGHAEVIWPTNPLDRLNKEIKGRTDVVGVLSDPPALPRLRESCWSRRMRNGRYPTAATPPRAPWPSSTDPTPTRRSHSRPDGVIVPTEEAPRGTELHEDRGGHCRRSSLLSLLPTLTVDLRQPDGADAHRCPRHNRRAMTLTDGELAGTLSG